MYSEKAIAYTKDYISTKFNWLDDINSELSNTIANYIAFKYDNIIKRNEKMFLSTEGIEKLSHVMTSLDAMGEMIRGVRAINSSLQPRLRKYTEQYIIDVIKYGLNPNGNGLSRHWSRQFRAPILKEDGDFYKKIR